MILNTLETIPFTQEDIDNAQARAKAMGEIANSITQGRANKSAFLCENDILRSLDEPLSDEKDFDFLHKNYRCEIKTKRGEYDPQPHYDASIADTSIHQNPDIYIFCRIIFAEKRGKGIKAEYFKPQRIWFCGWDYKDSYFEKATYHKKGDYDPSNKFYFKNNCYNVPYSKLRSFTQFKMLHPK